MCITLNAKKINRSRCFNRDFTKENKWLISSEKRLSLDSPEDIQIKPIMGQSSTLTRKAITEKFYHELGYREIRSLILAVRNMNDTVTLENGLATSFDM